MDAAWPRPAAATIMVQHRSPPARRPASSPRVRAGRRRRLRPRSSGATRPQLIAYARDAARRRATTTPRSASRTPSSARCARCARDDARDRAARRGCTRSSATAASTSCARPAARPTSSPHEAVLRDRGPGPVIADRPPRGARRASSTASTTCPSASAGRSSCTSSRIARTRRSAARWASAAGATKALVCRRAASPPASSPVTERDRPRSHAARWPGPARARLVDERGDDPAASSASGCHCTPSAKRWPGSSTASGSSSRARDRPVTTKPVAERVDALVVVALGRGASSRRPRARPASPRPRRTSWSAPSKVPGVRRCSSWPWRLGQVLEQRAAARDVHAAASRGRCPAAAGRAPSRARASAISNASRSRHGADRLGCGSAP